MSVPVLRFKDDSGRDFAEWQSEMLGSFAESIASGKSDTRADKGDYSLYGSTGTIGSAKTYDYQGERLLIARVGANAGYLYRVNGDYCVSDNTLMFTLKTPNNYSFFYNLLTKIDLNKLVFGSGQPLITGGHLKALSIAVPSIPEQTKIANFLTAVDEKITQLTQKCELLAQYKKGVMQQIFSQELRFKDDNGQEFPEWEVSTLGEVTELFSRRNKKLINAEVYSVTNTNGFVLQTEHFEDRVVAGADLSNYKIIYKDEFAYNPARINVGSIALFTGELGVISSLYVCFRCKPSLDKIFLLNYLELDSTIQNISSFGEGGVRIYLWYPLFAQIPISLPSVQEQIKIANFLTAIDDKLTHSNNQLIVAKQYKQGLLQQMFI